MAKELRITSTGGISAAGGLSACADPSFFACNVGIGTNKPARDLSIVGSGANALLQIANCDTGSTSDNGLEIFMSSNSAGIVNRESGYLRFDTDNCERMRITACGCVGINCTGPGRTLAVGGDAEINTNLIVNTALYTKDWYGIGSNAQRLLNSSGTELVRVTCGGNVGIGATCPSAPLDFGKTTYDSPSGENFYRIKLKDQGGIHNDVGIGQQNLNSMGFNITPGGCFTWYAGTNKEKMRLDSSGCLGIGTTSPCTTLDVAGTIRMTSSLRVNNGSNKLILYGDSSKTELHAAGTDGIIFKDSGNNEKARLTTSGCLGINEDSVDAYFIYLIVLL
jgi:hypothetical protein